jgi:hypothetical protein
MLLALRYAHTTQLVGAVDEPAVTVIGRAGIDAHRRSF